MGTGWKLSTRYSRVKTHEVAIGKWRIGGNHPIGIQSMTNTNTLDVAATLKQAEAIIAAGGEAVRCTTQGIREAEALGVLRKELDRKHPDIPLVADVHFNANAAFTAARLIEKVRINPGNFFLSRQLERIGNDEEELALIRTRLFELIDLCKKHHTALRIGVNHGSLSERMMKRHGNTPKGMVASAMEYLRLCKEANFHNVVVSMKSSNPKIMVHANRLLVQAMHEEDMAFPIHLGVTEAGEGEDGRVKSAVGIGALLADGIGDTLRVSLTEAPEREIPVARLLAQHFQEQAPADLTENEITCINPVNYQRRATRQVGNVGAGQVPVVISNEVWQDQPSDYVLRNNKLCSPDGNELPLLNSWAEAEKYKGAPKAMCTNWYMLQEPEAYELMVDPGTILVVMLTSSHPVGEARACIQFFEDNNIQAPVIFRRTYHQNPEEAPILAAADLGVLCLDGLADGLWLTFKKGTGQQAVETAFGILQSTHDRITKTEYISCPGCGRTLFDLETTARAIREQTAHLKGLKIGIMGCIVNGPGEMADAHYGYVGAGPGKIALYKGQTCVRKQIPEEEAVDALIALIKEHGDWHNPE